MSRHKSKEMIFNIRWRNRSPYVDTGTPSWWSPTNMVGMLDGSATSDYYTFKSYLLTNSGTFVDNIDNILVSYVEDGEEYCIESDIDYSYALSYFRERANIGRYIDLTLDYIEKRRKDKKEKKEKETQPPEWFLKYMKKFKEDTQPPEWFLKYMKKFKEEIVEEMTAVIISKQHQCNSHPTRKLKAESYKRSRKVPLLIGDPNDRELPTAVKVQRKIENKLEKLEHKSIKIKTKKALMGLSSDSDAGKSSKSETNQPQSTDSETLMSAALSMLPNKKSHIAYLSGGETYVHSWEVINDGTLPWNSSTKLRYAWGSQALEPWEKDISCPYLKPGQTGCINATFNIPVIPGMYECYWHFYNNGKRFGISLSSVVVVADNPVRAEGYIRGPTYDVINLQDNYELVLPTTWTSPPQKQKEGEKETKCEIETNQIPTKQTEINDEIDGDTTKINHDKLEEENDDKSGKVEGLKEENNTEVVPSENLLTEDNINSQEDDKNVSADFEFLDESDDQSIISISDSNVSASTKSGEDFILLQDGGAPNSDMLLSFVNHEDDLVEAIEDAKKSTLDVVESNSDVKGSNLDKTSDDATKESTENGDLEIKENIEKANVDSTDNIQHKTEKEIVITSSENNEIQKINEVGIEAGNVGDTEDILKIVKTPIESCEPCKDTTTEYAYIVYKGRKIPVPKHYLREDYLKTAEEVPKEVIPNINYLLIDSFLRMESASGLRRANEENGAIPKTVKSTKKEKNLSKMKSKSSTVSTNTPKKEKKSEKSKTLSGKNDSSTKKVSKQKEEKRLSKKETSVMCCSSAPLNEVKRHNEISSNNQRFFVFPQQSPGYEIVHHFPKSNGVYDCDPTTTAAEDESVFVKLYVLYKAENYDDTDFYAYFVPLNHVEQYPPELEETIDKRELMHYAIPADVNSLVNSTPLNADYFDYKYVLLPLRQGILCADFRYPPIMKQNLYNLVDLQSTFDYHKRMDHASTARIGNEHCVLTLNAEDYFVYEVKTVTRYVAINLNIRPQMVIPQYNLKLYTITPPSFKQTKMKKSLTGKKIAEASNGGSKVATTQKKKDESRSASKTETNGNLKKASSPPPKAKENETVEENEKKTKMSGGDSTVVSPELGSSLDSESGKAEFFHLLKGKMDGLKKTVIDTAKEVIDIVTPPTRSNDGYWCQGHWISTNPNSKREQALNVLHEMGFGNRDLNATLLARFGDDLTVALTQLLEYNLDV